MAIWPCRGQGRREVPPSVWRCRTTAMSCPTRRWRTAGRPARLLPAATVRAVVTGRRPTGRSGVGSTATVHQAMVSDAAVLEWTRYEAERSGPVEIEVAVLGPTLVRGSATPFSRTSALELVAYLAMHPGGAANDAWATALWPDRLMAPATLYSTASAARRGLGTASNGVDHLPRAHGR